MTFYDDGEFAAIKIAQIANAEWEGEPRTTEMHAVLTDMFERHGQDGITALVVALGRQYITALHVVADHQEGSVEALLDSFERHKLEQIEAEGQR